MDAGQPVEQLLRGLQAREYVKLRVNEDTQEIEVNSELLRDTLPAAVIVHQQNVSGYQNVALHPANFECFVGGRTTVT